MHLRAQLLDQRRSLPPPASSLARNTVEWSKSLTDPASRLSWDDLRVIRAIGKTGALATGAELLGINTSTIARRLSKMEEVLGATLFDRRRTGYVATVQGQELIALAERVELDVVGVARRVAGHWQRSEEHTSELQSLMRISYAVFCLKKKN